MITGQPILDVLRWMNVQTQTTHQDQRKVFFSFKMKFHILIFQDLFVDPIQTVTIQKQAITALANLVMRTGQKHLVRLS